MRACFAGRRAAEVTARQIVSLRSARSGKAASREVDALFAPLMKGARPGAVVLVARNGRTIHKKAYGMADIRQRVPLTPASIFDIGSISKPFTALAVMQLAEQGKLDFDDRLARFFPAFRANASAVRLRHLLQHTAGFPDYAELLQLTGHLDRNYPRSTARAKGGPELTSADVLEILARQKLRFAPGTEFEYSNSAYVLLGQVVAKASGQSYAAFLDDRVFRPLGLTRTIVCDESRPSIPGRALSYRRQKSKYTSIKYTPLNLIYGDGNINSTVEDLVKLEQALYADKLVRPRTLAEALRPGRLNDGRETGYGFGWCVRPALGLPRIGHGGIWLGFKSLFVCFPRQRLVIILLANFAEFDRVSLASQIAKLYLRKEMIIPDRIPIAAPALQSFTGVYDACKWLKSSVEICDDEIDPDEHYTVTVHSGRLWLQRSGCDRWVLRPVWADEFLVEGERDTRVAFHRGVDERVRALSITNFMHQSARKRDS